MGVWGVKSFDNDTAFCFNDMVVKPLVAQLRHIVENPALADPKELASFKVMAAAKSWPSCASSSDSPAPPMDLVEECRDVCLQGWDAADRQAQPKAGAQGGTAGGHRGHLRAVAQGVPGSKSLSSGTIAGRHPSSVRVVVQRTPCRFVGNPSGGGLTSVRWRKRIAAESEETMNQETLILVGAFGGAGHWRSRRRCRHLVQHP